MYGLWCLFGLIVLSGGTGGLIYSLSSPTTHTLMLPSRRARARSGNGAFRHGEIESGFAGHVIIGIGGAVVAVAASVPILDINLDLYDRIWTLASLPAGLVPSVIFISAIGVLGGFSGLKIISGLSDAMLNKIQQEVNALRSQNEQLKDELEKNSAGDKAREKELEEIDAKSELFAGLFFIKVDQPEDGVQRVEEYLKTHPDHVEARIWLGSGYKRLHDYGRALECAEEAIRLAPTNWLAWYNKACYLSLVDSERVDSVLESLRRAFEFVPSHRREELLKDLQEGGDCDFEKVRGQQSFQNFIKELTIPR